MEEKKEKKKKRAVVIGAGIAGVSTAYYLARCGYDVTCLEKNARVAREASYLNGGLVCPSLTLPWPCFGLLKTALVSILKGDGNVRVKWSQVLFDPQFYRWSLSFLRNCTRVDRNFRASYDLSNFSKICMNELPIKPESYRKTAKGTLSLFPSVMERDGALSYIRSTLLERGPRLHKVDAKDCVAKVPLLGRCIESRKPKAGIFSDEDFTGDICSFTELLAREAEREGVSFVFSEQVSSTEINKARVTSLTLSSSKLKIENPDVVVVCAGNATPKIARDFGDVLLQIPVLGYALEVPTSNPLQISVVDDANKVYAAPLNSADFNAVRISGFVEFGESSMRIERPNEKEKELSMTQAQELLSSASKFFPKGFIRDSCELKLISGEDDVLNNRHNVVRAHVCMRPQTPDDLPIIGKSQQVKNVYYNAGHGHLGWTRAVGASRILAECVTGWTTMKSIHSEDSIIPAALQSFQGSKAYSPARWAWF